MPSNWMLEKTPESSLDSKEIKPVNLKGDQSWIFTGRTAAEAPVFWSSDANNWLTGEVPDAGKDWGKKEKRASEDAMAGRYHQCNEHELGQTLGDGEGQGSLVCCCPGSHKESDTTGLLNNNNMSPPSWACLPPTLPPHPSRSSQSTELNSFCYTSASH